MDKKKNRNPKSQKPKESKPKQGIDESFDEIFTEDYYGKDFEFLEKQPVSESDNSFLFKFEKEWTIVDANKYEAEFFSLDLRKLEQAIGELRFNDLVGIEERYFTSDQLTSIENEAQRIKESNRKSSANTKDRDSTDQKDGTTHEGTSEELDFLLSLEEPVAVPSTLLKQSTTYGSISKQARKENTDLEKWLDSVLED